MTKFLALLAVSVATISAAHAEDRMKSLYGLLGTGGCLDAGSQHGKIWRTPWGRHREGHPIL